MIDMKIESSWEEVLKEEFEKEYFSKLTNFIQNEYSTKKCFPPVKLIFNAFEQTPINKVKVVILGQDPYHGDNQAHGLSFSVPDGVKTPPSLRNIFKEINLEYKTEIRTTSNLQSWSEQGVLLLNAILTVEAHNPGSHQKKGWETFTDKVIKTISNEKENVVFLLWGSYAKKKSEYIDEKKHLILNAVHPSPLSAHRGFFGCNHFIKANEYLERKGQQPIAW